MATEMPISRYLRALMFSAFVFGAMALFACGQQQSVSSSDSADSSSSASSVLLDLSNSADRALVNECLSWMSQEFAREPSAIDVSDSDDQVRLAVHYLGLTDYATWEFGDYTAIAGQGGGAGGATNVRVAADRVSEVAKQFFGVAPDFASMDGMFKCIDDYIYFGVTAPVGQTAAYSAATSLEPAEDGSYTAAFEVYEGNMPYEAKDESFYAKTSADMMAELGVSAPLRTGTAKLRPVDHDGKVSLVVESYALDDAKDVDDSAAASTVITTPYYTVEIPADWPVADNDLSYETSEELIYQDGAPQHGLGCTTSVYVYGGSISVTCFTDSWDVQGDFKSIELGTPANMPGWHVSVYTASTSMAKRGGWTDMTGYLDEFASFVTPAPA